MASSQGKLCSSLAPSSSSTCWSSVVCGLFPLSLTAVHDHECVLDMGIGVESSYHTGRICHPFQTECDTACFRNLYIFIVCLLPVAQKLLIKCKMLNMFRLTFGLLCIRRLPGRPCFLPLLHDTILLHHASAFLPQLVS